MQLKHQFDEIKFLIKSASEKQKLQASLPSETESIENYIHTLQHMDQLVNHWNHDIYETLFFSYIKSFQLFIQQMIQSVPDIQKYCLNSPFNSPNNFSNNQVSISSFQESHFNPIQFCYEFLQKSDLNRNTEQICHSLSNLYSNAFQLFLDQQSNATSVSAIESDLEIFINETIEEENTGTESFDENEDELLQQVETEEAKNKSLLELPKPQQMRRIGFFSRIANYILELFGRSASALRQFETKNQYFTNTYRFIRYLFSPSLLSYTSALIALLYVRSQLRSIILQQNIDLHWLLSVDVNLFLGELSKAIQLFGKSGLKKTLLLYVLSKFILQRITSFSNWVPKWNSKPQPQQSKHTLQKKTTMESNRRVNFEEEETLAAAPIQESENRKRKLREAERNNTLSALEEKMSQVKELLPQLFDICKQHQIFITRLDCLLKLVNNKQMFMDCVPTSLTPKKETKRNMKPKKLATKLEWSAKKLSKYNNNESYSKYFTYSEEQSALQKINEMAIHSEQATNLILNQLSTTHDTLGKYFGLFEKTLQ